jgi:hypothetical protein
LHIYPDLPVICAAEGIYVQQDNPPLSGHGCHPWRFITHRGPRG